MTAIRHVGRQVNKAISTTALLALSGVAGVYPSTSAGEVHWEGGITTVVQHADDSRADTEVTASADLFATLATGGGEWLLYVEASTKPRLRGVSRFYPTANGDAGSVLTNDGDGGVQISEFNYTIRPGGGNSLMLGLIDPSAWLDRGRIANDENQHFLNGSFVNNATIEFPDYTLGMVYRSTARGRRPEVTVVIAGSDGIADLPDRSYQDLLDFNDEGRGLFAGSGASWLFDRLSLRIGAWIRTDDHEVAGRPEEKEDNFGVYGVFGWQSGPHALNVRTGFANTDVSVAGNFLGVAYQRAFQFGLFGIGAAHTAISSGYRTGNRDSAFDSEIFLRIPILGGAGHVTPSIQYVEVPGFDATETVPGSTALIAGIRLHYSF